MGRTTHLAQDAPKAVMNFKIDCQSSVAILLMLSIALGLTQQTANSTEVRLDTPGSFFANSRPTDQTQFNNCYAINANTLYEEYRSRTLGIGTAPLFRQSGIVTALLTEASSPAHPEQLSTCGGSRRKSIPFLDDNGRQVILNGQSEVWPSASLDNPIFDSGHTGDALSFARDPLRVDFNDVDQKFADYVDRTDEWPWLFNLPAVPVIRLANHKAAKVFYAFARCRHFSDRYRTAKAPPDSGYSAPGFPMTPRPYAPTLDGVDGSDYIWSNYKAATANHNESAEETPNLNLIDSCFQLVGAINQMDFYWKNPPGNFGIPARNMTMVTTAQPVTRATSHAQATTGGIAPAVDPYFIGSLRVQIDLGDILAGPRPHFFFSGKLYPGGTAVNGSRNFTPATTASGIRDQLNVNNAFFSLLHSDPNPFKAMAKFLAAFSSRTTQMLPSSTGRISRPPVYSASPTSRSNFYRDGTLSPESITRTRDTLVNHLNLGHPLSVATKLNHFFCPGTESSGCSPSPPYNHVFLVIGYRSSGSSHEYLIRNSMPFCTNGTVAGQYKSQTITCDTNAAGILSGQSGRRYGYQAWIREDPLFRSMAGVLQSIVYIP